MGYEEKPRITYEFSNCLNYHYDVNIFDDARVSISIQDDTYYETRGGGISKWGEIYGEKEELDLIEKNVRSLISVKENPKEREEYYFVIIRLREDDGKILSNSF